MGFKEWLGIGAAAAGAAGGMNAAEAAPKQHQKMEKIPAAVEKNQMSGLQEGLRLALEEANKGSDESTGRKEFERDGEKYTVTYERKNDRLLAHVVAEVGGQKDAETYVLAETKVGKDNASNDVYEYVAGGTLDDVEGMMAAGEAIRQSHKKDRGPLASE